MGIFLPLVLLPQYCYRYACYVLNGGYVEMDTNNPDNKHNSAATEDNKDPHALYRYIKGVLSIAFLLFISILPALVMLAVMMGTYIMFLGMVFLVVLPIAARYGFEYGVRECVAQAWRDSITLGDRVYQAIFSSFFFQQKVFLVFFTFMVLGAIIFFAFSLCTSC